MRETDILHETGPYWVGRTPESYTVYRNGVTHATPESSYAPTPDGLSIAIARADYLAKRKGATVNQCDGCRRGLPIRNGIHWNDGKYDHIGCTAHLYPR